MAEPESQDAIDSMLENNLEDMLDQAVDDDSDEQSTDTSDSNVEPISATRWSLPVMKADPDNIIRYEEEEENKPKRRRDDKTETPEITALEKLKQTYTAQWREELKKEIYEELHDVAHDEGYQHGFQKGLDQSIKETKHLQQQLTSLIHCVEKPLENINEEVEEQIELLAVTLAQQLVRRELKTNPGEIIGLIRESLKLLPASSRKIKITIHPEDAALVKEALSIDEKEEDLKCVFLEDPLLSRGGCIIRSEQSVVNVSLENRLASLAGSVLSGSRAVDDSNDDENGNPQINEENALSSVETETETETEMPLNEEVSEDKNA